MECEVYQISTGTLAQPVWESGRGQGWGEGHTTYKVKYTKRKTIKCKEPDSY